MTTEFVQQTLLLIKQQPTGFSVLELDHQLLCSQNINPKVYDDVLTELINVLCETKDLDLKKIVAILILDLLRLQLKGT